MFKRILPSPDDRAQRLPGDDRIPDPDLTIDSAFELPAPPRQVFPWLLQLGKRRGGWYFTRFAEKFFFPSARGIRRIEPR